MNIQEIDKWLYNEYGTSYTRLEELHDYFFEKYTDQKEEIERLNKELDKTRLSELNKEYIINELEKRLIDDRLFFEDVYKKSHLSEEEFRKQCPYTIGSYDHSVEILGRLQELKGDKNNDD